MKVTKSIVRRAVTFSAGVVIGLSSFTGMASAAPKQPDSTETASSTTGNEGQTSSTQDCDGTHHSDTGHGANNQEDNGYANTCSPEHEPANGQELGPGQHTGRPCAGCVGNADDKNPPGQYRDGGDENSGYECDGRDRRATNQQGNGNHGVGDENPAHTGCAPAAAPLEAPPTCPDGSAMPAGSNSCAASSTCPDGSAMPAEGCNPTCPEGSMPGNGNGNAAERCTDVAVRPANVVTSPPANPRPVRTDVLGVTLSNPAASGAANDAGRGPEVLGVTLDRSEPAGLARTGPGSALPLLLGPAVMFIAAGVSLLSLKRKLARRAGTAI